MLPLSVSVSLDEGVFVLLCAAAGLLRVVAHANLEVCSGHNSSLPDCRHEHLGYQLMLHPAPRSLCLRLVSLASRPIRPWMQRHAYHELDLVRRHSSVSE
jgi:hypothetical protein